MTISTPRSLSAFMIRPMAISLPGICFDEKITVSPSASLSSWLPKAIRPSAARGSPCPPVAMISTSLARQAHRLVEADRLGEIEQIAGRLGDLEDAVEGAAGDAHLAPGFDRDPADRLAAARRWRRRW